MIEELITEIERELDNKEVPQYIKLLLKSQMIQLRMLNEVKDYLLRKRREKELELFTGSKRFFVYDARITDNKIYLVATDNKIYTISPSLRESEKVKKLLKLLEEGKLVEVRARLTTDIFTDVYVITEIEYVEEVYLELEPVIKGVLRKSKSGSIAIESRNKLYYIMSTSIKGSKIREEGKDGDEIIIYKYFDIGVGTPIITYLHYDVLSRAEEVSR